MSNRSIGERIERAATEAKMSQRMLAKATEISQPTLSRIISGERPAKMPEILAIAWATGTTVAELIGASTVADRAQCAARATNETGMAQMRDALLHFLELDAYLDAQGIPSPA